MPYRLVSANELCTIDPKKSKVGRIMTDGLDEKSGMQCLRTRLLVSFQ